MSRVLGLDISSKTIGFGVLDIDRQDNISFVDGGFFSPPKKGSIFERLSFTKNHISSLLKKYNPDYIAIEEIVQFMKGGSGAKTIIALATFNRMIGLLSYEFLSKEPTMLNVLSIRHGLKLNKKFPAKEEMPELVAKHLNIKFPYVYDKKNKPKIENNDMADGIAVALYQSFILTNKIKKK